MKKNLFIEIPLAICVSYTIISLSNNIFSAMKGYEHVTIFNGIMMLIWCTIAVLTLYGQKLLHKWSPLLVMLIQYIFAISMIVLTIFITGFFDELHPDAYRDGITSFSVFFVIGAIVYYVSHFIEANKQNKLLQSIKAKK